MATSGTQDSACRLVKDSGLELENAGSEPYYNGVVVTEDKLLVIDGVAWNLQLYRRLDGKLMSTSHGLESRPRGVCLISKTEVAVCLDDSTIVILSLKSIDDVKLVKTFDVKTGFDRCDSVAKLNSDKLVVSGWKREDGRMLYWCVVNLTDGHVDSTHKVCKGSIIIDSDIIISDSHLAIKNDTIYISCWTKFDSTVEGVYAYDILNPNTPKFLYQHDGFTPYSIMVDERNFIYVCGYMSNSIHQLTDSGQPVTIHTVSPRPDGIFYDDQHGVLYTTSRWSNVITVYRMEYSHQPGVPIEILKMDDKSIQLFEEALKDGKETVYNIRIMVVGHSGVGKTTLVKRLLGEEVNISERCSTEGIDVYVNCCDVSLLNCEWTRQSKDYEQDYRLQRLARVLNEQQSMKDKAIREEQVIIPPQGETTHKSHEVAHIEVEGKESEVLYIHTPQHDVGQDLSSTASQQEKSPPALVQAAPIQSETNTIAMLKLLQKNVYKLKQDADKTSPLTIWDFAGQYAFYTTHQTFLTRRAIYLLVSDVSKELSDLVADEFYFDSDGIMKCKVHELIEVWLNSIHSCALSAEARVPPVILVGTHVDKISQGRYYEICESYFRQIRSYLKDKPTRFHLVDKDFAIDNTIVDSKLEDLKRTIVEVASQQPYWGEEIPARWLLLEQELMKRKAAGVKVISRLVVEQMSKEGTLRIEKSEELDLFLRFLHETGIIIYFSIEVLRDSIVLDPIWMIDALKSLINVQPNLPESPADSTVSQKWSDFKEKGILHLDVVDAIWTNEKYPELHANKEHILLIMEQLNVIAKPRVFSEIGEKVENYFLTPCMLRQESPREVIFPEKDTRMVSTPVLCFVFTGKFLPPPIFHRLLAACVAHWPVSKKKETAEYLIFCGCCVFDLDLFHRLTLHCRNHIVYARITRMVVDEVNNPDAKLCTRVRKFITLNLSKITSYLGQNLQYKLCFPFPSSEEVLEDDMFHFSPYQAWFAEEGQDPDASITASITHEHMNYARLCIALATVCGNAMREILLSYVPDPHTNIYQAIMANKTNLTTKTQIRRGQWQNALLSYDQGRVVFPDPWGRYVAAVDQFDITLLYTLIRKISTVPIPMIDWGFDPPDHPRDTSLAASVERIRLYRNIISGHSAQGKISQKDFEDYWHKIEAVINDIEHVIGGQVFSVELNKQRKQVISIYEAC